MTNILKKESREVYHNQMKKYHSNRGNPLTNTIIANELMEEELKNK